VRHVYRFLQMRNAERGTRKRHDLNVSFTRSAFRVPRLIDMSLLRSCHGDPEIIFGGIL
jgi:hypothetical protein